MLRASHSIVACAVIVGSFTAVSPFARTIAAQSNSRAALPLHDHRTSNDDDDLEIGGELTDFPAGTTRYLSRRDLLSLPQATHTLNDYPNYPTPTRLSGVLLEELIHRLSVAPESDMVVAICDDAYRANYSRDYLAAHNPLLVLAINGQPPSGWPKDAEGHDQSMGPYMIADPLFVPRFRIFAHAEEAQIPWGVVRLEFRDEKKVFGAIAPRGPHASDELVQDGYRIAKENCYRCHNMGSEGGTKAHHPWLVLSAWAATSPDYFAAYVRNPQSRNRNALMPGNPGYDDQTIAALAAYFQTFSQPVVLSPAVGEKP